MPLNCPKCPNSIASLRSQTRIPSHQLYLQASSVALRRPGHHSDRFDRDRGLQFLLDWRGHGPGSLPVDRTRPTITGHHVRGSAVQLAARFLYECKLKMCYV